MESHEPDLSHLSERKQAQIREEMKGGAERLAKHAPAIAAAQKGIERTAADTGREIELTGADIVARQEAADRLRAEEAEEIRLKNAEVAHEKAILDQNEAMYGRIPAAPSDVVDAAKALVEQREEQAEGRLNNSAAPLGALVNPDAPAEQARQEGALASATKEVMDRAESANYQGEHVYQGVGEQSAVVAVERYDDNGDPIENEDPNAAGNGQIGENEGEGVIVHAEVVAEETEATKPKGRKPRVVPTPARAVGDGPKSE